MAPERQARQTGGGGDGGGDVAALAARLRRDLAALAAGGGAATAADLRLALDAVDRLEAAVTPPATGLPLPVLDAAPLRRLMALAGPADRAELIRRLDEDLAAAGHRLEAALPDLRLEEFRAATHVLISLAGSVGGRATEALARDLNGAVHERAPQAGLAERGRRLVAAVGALRAALARALPETGGGTPDGTPDGAPGGAEIGP